MTNVPLNLFYEKLAAKGVIFKTLWEGETENYVQVTCQQIQSPNAAYRRTFIVADYGSYIGLFQELEEINMDKCIDQLMGVEP